MLTVNCCPVLDAVPFLWNSMFMTKGQIEAKISEGLINFEKEYMGRGPLETKAYIIDDMILVRLKGVLTRAEQQLVRSKESRQGRQLIKQVRRELIEEGRSLLEPMIREITGIDVVSLHTDISTKTGERVIIFTLEKKVL
ncbi:MAG: DUF2294 domain-containing protein [Spirochaetia bacterium]